MKIKLLHLYYDIMNLYGEYGNIKILEQHIKDQGFEVIVDKKTINEEKNFEEYDFIYIGCGTEKNQKVILEDIKKDKEEFKEFIEDGNVVLLTGNSYEIIGKSINSIEGLKFLDFKVETIENRITSDVIYTSDILKNKVVGFINNMSSIENNKEPLFKVEFGEGENKQSRYEGVNYKCLYGTHLIGPALIRNPEFLKLIIQKTCERKDADFIYKNKEYLDEKKGYELVLAELEARENN